MTPPPATTDFISEKLDFIADQVAKLSEKFDRHLEATAALRVSVERSHSRLDRAESDIAKNAADIREMAKFMPYVRALGFLSAGLAIPLVLGFLGFVWAVITHQIDIP